MVVLPLNLLMPVAHFVKAMIIREVETAITFGSNVVRGRDVRINKGPDELKLFCVRIHPKLLNCRIGADLLLIQERSGSSIDRGFVVHKVELHIVVSIDACKAH